MREIKFRGMDYSGHWCYGDLLHSESGEVAILEEKFRSIGRVDLKSVGEFTGLKDKNGKEIWEGDLVKWNSWGQLSHEYPDEGRDHYWGIGPVIYVDKIAQFFIDAMDGDDNSDDDLTRINNGHELCCGFGDDLVEFEVIGNITEHPDLVK